MNLKSLTYHLNSMSKLRKKKSLFLIVSLYVTSRHVNQKPSDWARCIQNSQLTTSVVWNQFNFAIRYRLLVWCKYALFFIWFIYFYLYLRVQVTASCWTEQLLTTNTHSIIVLFQSSSECSKLSVSLVFISS